MRKTALLAKQIPFDADKALSIIEDYKLPKNRFYEWQNRGSIPSQYLSEANPITLIVDDTPQTRPLFFWRVRLGLKLKDVAEWCNVGASFVSKWEKGTHTPRPQTLQILQTNFQTLIKTAY